MPRFNVGQLLVCDENVLATITGLYHRDEEDISYYYLEFSDDEVNLNYQNAVWFEDDIERWYYNYLDMAKDNNENSRQMGL